MRRQHFLELCGFDPLYEPAYYEDVDLALRLRSIGLLTYYCGEAVVVHQENATSNTMWTPRHFEELISKSHGRFAKRWGEYLEARMTQDCEPNPLPALRWQPEPKAPVPNAVALYLDESLALNETSKCFLAAAGALNAIRPVTLVFNTIYSRCRVYSLCRHFGVELPQFALGVRSALAGDRLYDLKSLARICPMDAVQRADDSELAHLLSEIDRPAAI
jgi:hypothetical protein